MPQTLSIIKQLLAERGLRPRYRFGQNFLHDPNKLRTIMDAVDIHPDDVVLEVGPGTGVLTERLLEAGGRVVAVEIDRDLSDILRDRIGADSDQFVLINDDALASKHSLDPQIAEALRGFSGGTLDPWQAEWGRFQLVANLPYNIASPLLMILAMDWPNMHRATVMLQREVADRILAPPGGKDYGPLGIMLQALCEVTLVTKLSPNCFWPPPKVSSAVVQLTRRAEPLTRDPQRLGEMLHRLFSKRRKQLGAILGRDTALPPGIDANARPEQLSVEQLIELAEAMPSSGERET
ncbi:MAG: 16S rRNA (adenine(1518)-N(6)/adenine(1519)-N(6))-dimethyltransferase RsmA [Phycisphaeraceae bacterium]